MARFIDPLEDLFRCNPVDGCRPRQFFGCEKCVFGSGNHNCGGNNVREIFEHTTPGDAANHQIQIKVMDEPGPGGANHEYRISWGESTDTSSGPCMTLHFQNGPIKDVGVNGVTHEALIAIILDRLRAFQRGKFSHRSNRIAIEHLETALESLKGRTLERMARGVEGSHQV